MGKNSTFIAGMATAVLLIAVGLFTWAALLIIEVQPAVKMSKRSKVTKKYTRTERREMVQSLQKLYHLCKFLGLREYSSMAIGSAGYITSLDRSRASTLKAKYFLLQAIEEAEYVVQNPPSNILQTLDPMDPLLEAYFHYSMFLNNHGEKIEAKRTLRRAKKMAESNGSNSPWIKSINKTIHAMNMGTI